MAVSPHRVCIFYIIVGVIGSVVLVLSAPFVRVHIVEKELHIADVLLTDGRHLDAFVRLGRIRTWASFYPPLNRRRNCGLVRCHLKLGDRNAAENVAEEILNGMDLIAPAPAGICEVFNQWSNSLISNQISARDPGVRNKWAGYEIMVSELIRPGDEEGLRSLGERLLKKQPSARLRNLLEYHLGMRADDSQRDDVDAAAVGTDEGGVPGIDHYRRARDYLSRREWNQALEECRLGLKEDPGNKVLLRLMKQAKARGACWGVIRRDQAGIHDKNGKCIGTVAVGTLVDIRDPTDKGKQGMLCCTIATGEGLPHPVYIDGDNLEVIDGLLSQASGAERTLRARRVMTEVEIGRMERDLARTARKKNPHAEEYQAAKKKYDDFWAKVKDLQAKRDRALGDARTKYVDELRELKGQDAVLAGELEKIEDKHNAWESHRTGVVEGGEIQLLKAELASIDARLEALETGQ